MSSRKADGSGEVTFRFDTREEGDLLESAFARGTHWIRFDGDKVRLHAALEPPPAVPDKLTADHWQPGEVEERSDEGRRHRSSFAEALEKAGAVLEGCDCGRKGVSLDQHETFCEAAALAMGEVVRAVLQAGREEFPRKAWFVSGLQAYDGEYDRRAESLARAGFDCMRSRRGLDGRIWEHWYLSGRWAARGPIEGKSDDEILKWLVSLGPGTIVESGRHWGLALD